jgi:radical SAM protein (TIGR04043 family)
MTPRLIELKAKIFCHGLRIAPELWSELTDEDHYRHKRAGLSQGRFLRLFDGSGESTSVNAPVLEPFVERSPLWLEKREDGTYAVREGDEVLAECEPFPWPRWYRRQTSEGQPMSSVVSAHCETSLYTAIYQGGCDYWTGDQMCAFCAMKIDQKSRWRAIDSIIEVAQVAKEETPNAEISFGGGTRLTPDKGAKHKSEAIRRFRDQVDMRVCVEMAPPDTDDWLTKLHDSGCDSLLLNIEVWDEDLRRELMPGKAAITRQRYLDALAHSVKVFGSSQVSSQVIVGLEPLDGTLAAIQALIDVGAIPLPVVFRPLPGTPLAETPTPPIADVIQVFEQTHALMQTATLDGQVTRSGCALCGACSAHR